MLCADASCTVCGAKYTAWVGPTADGYGMGPAARQIAAECGFYDLSYRSTFNDEPGPKDLPKKKVKVFRVVQVGWRRHWFPI
jgi:hypothetical protein